MRRIFLVLVVVALFTSCATAEYDIATPPPHPDTVPAATSTSTTEVDNGSECDSNTR